jgi:hypothetical protein
VKSEVATVSGGGMGLGDGGQSLGKCVYAVFNGGRRGARAGGRDRGSGLGRELGGRVGE